MRSIHRSILVALAVISTLSLGAHKAYAAGWGDVEVATGNALGQDICLFALGPLEACNNVDDDTTP
jgi:hypothetical protein